MSQVYQDGPDQVVWVCRTFQPVPTRIRVLVTLGAAACILVTLATFAPMAFLAMSLLLPILTIVWAGREQASLHVEIRGDRIRVDGHRVRRLEVSRTAVTLDRRRLDLVEALSEAEFALLGPAAAEASAASSERAATEIPQALTSLRKT